MTHAEAKIAAVVDAAQALARAVSHEMEIHDQSDLEKDAAIKRLMLLENPNVKAKADGTQPTYSASAAAEIIGLDHQYGAYRKHCSEAVAARHVAWGMYDAAKLTAQLAVQMAEVVEYSGADR